MTDKDIQQFLAWIGTTLAGAGGLVGIYTKYLDYREKQRLAQVATLEEGRKTTLETKKIEDDNERWMIETLKVERKEYIEEIRSLRAEIVATQAAERKRCDEELAKVTEHFNLMLAQQNEKIRELVSEIAGKQ